jgi:hypothetical protein
MAQKGIFAFHNSLQNPTHTAVPDANSSMVLNIEWVLPGESNLPTVIVFTGFGHRLDPWTRFRPNGWRVGVVEFPTGNPPSEVWTPEALAAQVQTFWADAPVRALLSFSFGGAGATRVSSVLAKADAMLKPDFVAYIAPVQWAKAPWSILKRVRPHRRLRWLQRLSTGATKVSPISARLGGPALEQIVRIVENYVGWDFVAHYLPYIDWIDSKTRAARAWGTHPWPIYLVGASLDKTVPVRRMQSLVKSKGNIEYKEIEANHFNAIDSARPLLVEALEKLSNTTVS